MDLSVNCSTPVLLFGALCYWGLYVLYFSFANNNAEQLKYRLPNPVPQQKFGKIQTENSTLEKLVLMYTPLYGIATWNANFSKCSQKCKITTNRKDLLISDVVLFDAIHTRNKIIKIPPRGPKLEKQIRVFAIIESPGVFTTRFNMHIFDNAFNWSMTYRKDSDVPLLASRFMPIAHNELTLNSIPTEDFIKNKKLVAGMISRCRAESGRDAYIAELRKFIPVDMYGDCGNLMTCDKTVNCYPVLAKSYKFWLSFENSLCKEYITEKFFEPMRHGMVPVVYGSGPYSEVASNGSYINVRDFESPELLAEYLLHLNKNTEEYLQYFSWKKKFRITTADENNQETWCKFCEKLHMAEMEKTSKWYTDPGSWFRTNYTNASLCTKPSQIRIHYRKPRHIIF